MYLKKLKIGNVKLENNILLAPMAGITDLAFRKICKDFGAGLVCTEMLSSKAIFYNDSKTKLLMNTSGEKRPIAFQLFGSDEEAMGYATKYISNLADIIDINMGCPAPKVVKNGDGSKLLLDIKKAEKIITSVINNTNKPVTLKIRKGWDLEHVVAIEFAQMAESLGVSAITIHGRTKSEYFSGNVDLEVIKKVKNSVKIPVIGNGDITDEDSALKIFEYTGVDGIMLGRATLGHPWIFSQIIHFLETGNKLPEISNSTKLEIIKKHISLELEQKPNFDWLILLIAKTGMRFSEALAITPSDFDFIHQTLSITKTWDYKTKTGFMPTKNKSSVRKIPIDWQTIIQFRELVKELNQNERIFNFENTYNSTINDILQRRCKKANIPIISIHGLRHTHASILLFSGVSIASVAKRLGHSSMTTTQKTYLHIINELENKDIDLIMRAISNL